MTSSCHEPAHCSHDMGDQTKISHFQQPRVKGGVGFDDVREVQTKQHHHAANDGGVDGIDFVPFLAQIRRGPQSSDFQHDLHAVDGEKDPSKQVNGGGGDGGGDGQGQN